MNWDGCKTFLAAFGAGVLIGQVMRLIIIALT